MKNVGTKIKKSLKSMFALVFCFTLSVLGPCGTMMSTSAQTPVPGKSQKMQLMVNNARTRQATYQASATKYDSVMRSLGSLEQAPLKTEADVKKAISVLQKNQLSNDLILGKGFTIAIAVPAFKQGVLAEADRVTTSSLARQVNQKTVALSRIGGFSELKSSLKRQFDPDSATLSRIGQRLQAASRSRGISELFNETDIPAVAPHSHSNPATGFSFISAQFLRVPDAISDAMLMNAGYSAAPQFDPITLSTLGGIALAALAFIIITEASAKQQDTEEDPNTGISQIGACQADVKSKRDACLDKHDGDFFAQLGCWGTYTVDEAACLLLPL